MQLATILKNPTWDILVIIFFLAAGFLWGTMGGGRSKLLSVLFAIYLSLFLSPVVFKLLDTYQLFAHPYRNAAFYFGLVALISMLLDRTVFRAMPRASYHWWQALLLSFLEVGLFVAGTLNILAPAGIIDVSELTKALFAGSSAYLFWSIAPLVGLFFLSRSR